MAEVTWKATFIGAFLLFLIGVVVATCLNYAEASLTSIRAGISGPFNCHYDGKDPKSTEKMKYKCNETHFELVQDCIYLYVSYIPSDGSSVVKGIKLTPSYRYENPPKELDHRVRLINGTTNIRITTRGQCSAKYCGRYRFREANNPLKYKYNPDIIEQMEAAVKNNGSFRCYLSANRPMDGAYLYLNERGTVKNPEMRIFRWYEAWLILLAPMVIALAIIVFICALFFKGRLTALSDNQKPRETFIPPGFAPITSPTQDVLGEASSDGDSQPKFV